MRLYKANLDNDFNLISYVMPNETETIYSVREEKTYDILHDDIYEYIEMFGYLYFPIESDDADYTMFIDIDHTYSTVWDNQTSIYVSDQIQSEIRKNLIDAFFDEDESFLGSSEEKQKELLGITGNDKIYKDELTYLYHKCKGGIWESSNTDVLSIDKYSGVIKGKNIGKTTITYQVDTGSGMLTCFKNIEVVYE